jgi:hypothetical protein
MKPLIPLMLLSLVACGRNETIRSPLVADEGATPNPVAWQTPTVSLTAEDFWIVANGQRFTGIGAAIDIGGEPSHSTYTTLELEWMEHDVEMRLFIYFAADPTGWWSYEMRTYDAQPTLIPNWLYYRGPFFGSALGATFQGDLDLTNAADDPYRDELHLHGLALSTTLTGQ